ncbi:MAG: cytochrome b [Endozoicomonas sp.]
MTAPEKFPVLMRLIHWLMAICILGMVGSGWYMAGLSKDVSYKYDIYPWHKSFGVLVLFLLVARILVRLCSKFPPLPAGLPNHEKKLANLVHGLLYLLMLMVPLSGYMMSDAGGHDVLFFGIPMPDFLDDKDLAGFLHTVHGYIPYVMLGIIGLHVLGALKHRFMDSPENDVLKKML